MNKETEKYRHDIAKKIRQIRQGRLWTQTEFAKLLEISQNRFSEIERGKGSFTAEQLLLLSKTFNIGISDFVTVKGTAFQRIQNALARHGAVHLFENQNSLPSEKLEDVVDLVYETFIAAGSSRQIVALAPVIVHNATLPVLTKLRIRFSEAGLIHRFGWLLVNIRVGIKAELAESLNTEWKRKYSRADVILKSLIDLPWFKPNGKVKNTIDILDTWITTFVTLEEIRASSSRISKEWGIVTGIRPADFADALKEARETRLTESV